MAAGVLGMVDARYCRCCCGASKSTRKLCAIGPFTQTWIDSTRCYTLTMPTTPASRVFKTGWFSKASKKARIGDAELCVAVQEAMQGQADDLGGGVFKKRLNDNRHRSLVLAKGGRYWVYAYLFAKQDRANISADELTAFKALANAYARKTAKELDIELRNGDLLEICHDK